MPRSPSCHQTIELALNAISTISTSTLVGRIREIAGSTLKIDGFHEHSRIGERIEFINRNNTSIVLEIIKISENFIVAMGFTDLSAVESATLIHKALKFDRKQHITTDPHQGIFVHDSWIGRVIDPLCRPLDGRGSITQGGVMQNIRAMPPAAASRARLGPRIDTGIRAINTFVTCRSGQRLGVFAGSGVGKSTLLAMIARYSTCEIVVVALVGERGREVGEFIEDELGPQGIAKSILVVATSDQLPLMRKEAVYTAITIAEYFRDQGKDVLLIMDSITRFCTALREIALSLDETPATRGFPQSVFSELPRVLERAGPGSIINGHAGQITGIFTVLVEGDDLNDPVSDTVRGILDGHIILDREIAIRGRYPAIDLLRSISRCAESCLSQTESKSVKEARATLAAYYEISDIIKVGAYRPGTDHRIDNIISSAKSLENFASQNRTTKTKIANDFATLSSLPLYMPD